MAELLLVEALRRRGVLGSVRSAGLLLEGQPADRKAVAELRCRGLDLTGHRSQRLTGSLIESQDLVLTMERRHLEWVVDACPKGWPRSFVLGNLLTRADALGDRGDDDLAVWVARMHQGRRPADVVRVGAEHDVADPVGGSSRAFRRTAGLLEVAVDRLATALAGSQSPAQTGESEDLSGRWSLRRQ